MILYDPDDVVRGLRIWPEVIVYGGKLFSMINRRTYCIKHCNVPQEASEIHRQRDNNRIEKCFAGHCTMAPLHCLSTAKISCIHISLSRAQLRGNHL